MGNIRLSFLVWVCVASRVFMDGDIDTPVVQEQISDTFICLKETI